MAVYQPPLRHTRYTVLTAAVTRTVYYINCCYDTQGTLTASRSHYTHPVLWEEQAAAVYQPPLHDTHSVSKNPNSRRRKSEQACINRPYDAHCVSNNPTSNSGKSKKGNTNLTVSVIYPLRAGGGASSGTVRDTS